MKAFQKLSVGVCLGANLCGRVTLPRVCIFVFQGCREVQMRGCIGKLWKVPSKFKTWLLVCASVSWDNVFLCFFTSTCVSVSLSLSRFVCEPLCVDLKIYTFKKSLTCAAPQEAQSAPAAGAAEMSVLASLPLLPPPTPLLLPSVEN